MIPLTHTAHRLSSALARKSVSVTAFVATRLAIALVRGAAAHALSPRNAGKLSWRGAAFN
jgi:hypothetical protein